MSEEILNEIVENEILEEETQIPVKETEKESEILNETQIPKRVNPFCVISKAIYGEYAVRDIQTNSGWGANPYGNDYAVVPDDMVTDILETRGFCDIELNEDCTEVVSFTAREIPNIPVAEAEPTTEDILNALLGLEG